jgi:nitrogen-specific signal transduction histidine kinase
MKWKHTIIAIAIALLAVIGLQCFWLFRQYSTQSARLRQQLDDALIECDYEELFIRGQRLNHRQMSAEYSMSDNDQHRKQLWRSIHTERKGNVVKKTIVEEYVEKSATGTKQDSMANQLALDTATAHPITTIINGVRGGLHQVLDTTALPEVATFYNLLSAKTAAYGLDSRMRVELWKGGRLVCHTEGKGYSPRKAEVVGRLQWESDDHPMSYRVLSPPLGWVVLGNMAGVIVMSLVVICLLFVVFWMLIRSIRELQTVNEMKSDFVNNMTHELKTPISVAYAANDALLHFDQSLPKEKQTDYLKIALQQLTKLGQLVEQILQMTMERRTSLQLDMQQINPVPIINKLIEEYRLKADKPATFRLMGADQHPTVYADAAQLQHVVGNLLDNALKYSGSTVEITIGLETDKITVADNGMGIEREKLSYIFDKFYRVPQGNLHDVKGYGLGLYYVNNIMERMVGKVSVKSVVGRGSEFTLLFNQTSKEQKNE